MATPTARGLVQDGAAPAKTIEQLGDLELVDLVDRDVAHRLQGSMGPDWTRQRVDPPPGVVENRKLEPVEKPRTSRHQRFGALNHEPPRGDVDDPALVREPVHVLNDR